MFDDLNDVLLNWAAADEPDDAAARAAYCRAVTGCGREPLPAGDWVDCLPTQEAVAAVFAAAGRPDPFS